MSWDQILLPVYCAAGVLSAIYAWRWVTEDEPPALRVLSPSQRAVVAWIFGLTMLAAWPAVVAYRLFKCVTGERE